jgi:hypothetical protein
MSHEAKPNLSEAELALIQALGFVIGAIVVAEPNRRKGFDSGLAHFRDQFFAQSKPAAAAVIEHIRELATDDRSDAALLALLRRPAGGAA